MRDNAAAAGLLIAVGPCPPGVAGQASVRPACWAASRAVQLRSSIREVAVGLARGREARKVEIGQDQLLTAAGPGKVDAIRADHAAQPAIVEVALPATAVGVGEEDLVLERARRDQDARHGLERVHERGRHRHQIGAGKRQQADALGELEVVADQEPEPDAVQLDHLGERRAGAEHAAIQIAEQMALAVVREAAAVAADQPHGVVDRAAFAALGIAEQQRDGVSTRDRGDPRQGRAVRRLGKARRLLGTDVVAGEEHLRTDHETGAATGCLLCPRLEQVEVAGDGAGLARALIDRNPHHRTRLVGVLSIPRQCHSSPWTTSLMFPCATRRRAASAGRRTGRSGRTRGSRPA